MMSARIAIIGIRHVGRAMRDLFSQHAEIVTFDASGSEDYPAPELAACDAGIICVDTPMADDGACDTSHVRDAVGRLPIDRVLLKSTVPPGTTDLLVSTLGKQICFSPEYIGESSYHHRFWPGDTRDVPFMVLGGELAVRRWFMELFQPVLARRRSTFSAAHAKQRSLNTWRTPTSRRRSRSSTSSAEFVRHSTPTGTRSAK